MKRKSSTLPAKTRQIAWARSQRDRIVLALGGKCKACGSKVDLEFDCLEPKGQHHHGIGFVHRMCFYRKEMRHGNLQLLCSPCNSMKGDMTSAEWIRWLNSSESTEYYSLRIKGGNPVQQLPNSLDERVLTGGDL